MVLDRNRITDRQCSVMPATHEVLCHPLADALPTRYHILSTSLCIITLLSKHQWGLHDHRSIACFPEVCQDSKNDAGFRDNAVCMHDHTSYAHEQLKDNHNNHRGDPWHSLPNIRQQLQTMMVSSSVLTRRSQRPVCIIER